MQRGGRYFVRLGGICDRGETQRGHHRGEGLVHNVGSVFVVANSALLIMYHRRGKAVRGGI